jgi:hypothetical protein
VGAVGTPVRAGLASGALMSRALLSPDGCTARLLAPPAWVSAQQR